MEQCFSTWTRSGLDLSTRYFHSNAWFLLSYCLQAIENIRLIVFYNLTMKFPFSFSFYFSFWSIAELKVVSLRGSITSFCVVIVPLSQWFNDKICSRVFPCGITVFRDTRIYPTYWESQAVKALLTRRGKVKKKIGCNIDLLSY